MVKPILILSKAHTQKSPRPSASSESASPAGEAGRESPQPWGSSAAQISMGAARMPQPTIFWARARL